MSDPLLEFVGKTLPNLIEETQKLQSKERLIEKQNNFKLELLKAKEKNKQQVTNLKENLKNTAATLVTTNKEIQESLDILAGFGVVTNNLRKLNPQDQTEGGKELNDETYEDKYYVYNRNVQVGENLGQTVLNTQNKLIEAQNYELQLDEMIQGVKAGELASERYLAQGTDLDLTGDNLVSRADLMQYLDNFLTPTPGPVSDKPNPNMQPGSPFYQGFIMAGPTLEKAREARKDNLAIQKTELELKELKDPNIKLNEKIVENAKSFHNIRVKNFSAINKNLRDKENFPSIYDMKLNDVGKLNVTGEAFENPKLIQEIIAPIRENITKIIDKYGDRSTKKQLKAYEEAIQAQNNAGADKIFVEMINNASNKFTTDNFYIGANNTLGPLTSGLDEEDEIAKKIILDHIPHYMYLKKLQEDLANPYTLSADRNLRDMKKNLPMRDNPN